MLRMDAPAAFCRHSPGDFFDQPSELGLYRIREGLPTQLGVPEDLSDVADLIEGYEGPGEPKWTGTLYEVLWLYGENAPLEEDFMGSALHEAITSFWPDCEIVADDWL